MDEQEIREEIEKDLGKKIVEFGNDYCGWIGLFHFKTEDDMEYSGCKSGTVAEEIAREQLRDYPEDVLGLKGTALDYFDTERFIDDCIYFDGWQHQLCNYDGQNEETENGIVYWRD